MDLSLRKLWDMVKDREACPSGLCCSPWDDKELGMTEQLNNNIYFICKCMFVYYNSDM